MTDEPVNIHQPIFDICEALGVDPETVTQMVFTPATAVMTVTALERNDDWSFYVHPGTDTVATHELHFLVRT